MRNWKVLPLCVCVHLHCGTFQRTVHVCDFGFFAAVAMSSAESPKCCNYRANWFKTLFSILSLVIIFAWKTDFCEQFFMYSPSMWIPAVVFNVLFDRLLQNNILIKGKCLYQLAFNQYGKLSKFFCVLSSSSSADKAGWQKRSRWNYSSWPIFLTQLIRTCTIFLHMTEEPSGTS